MTRHLLGTAATLALLGSPAVAQTEAAGGTGAMRIEQCAPVITVTQTPPTVTVTMPANPDEEPSVTVTQAPPEVSVETCPPTVTGADGAQAEAEVVEAEPQINITAAETAELSVARADGGQATEAPASGAAAGQDAPAAGTQEAADTAQQPELPASQTGLVTAQDQAPSAAVEDQMSNTGAAATGSDVVMPSGQTTAPADMPEQGGSGTEAGQAQATDTTGTGEQPQAAEQTDAADPAQAAEPAGQPQTDAAATMGEGTEQPAGTTEAAADQAEAEEAVPSNNIAAPAPASETGDAPADAGAPAPADATSATNDVALREGNVIVPPAEALAGDVEGVSVYSADDEEIGQISRMDDQSQAAIVGVGGFLGLGERDVALPLSDLSFQRTAEGEIRAYAPIPSEQVDDLPEVPAAN
ncbi:MAG: hypothetical protein FJX25_14610 [Alphaproteobacteria bacterium]|nr:hypothetical protein [Alphaproteobacteria bacterium]